MKGVVIHMDDVLVFAESVEDHDTILREVLQRLHAEGVTLNKGKCVIGANCVRYLGHILSDTGISIDPQRVEAITKFPRPTSKTEILRFLGMVNFAREAQNNVFGKIKLKLQNSPFLAYFDPNKKIIVSSDSSSYGLGACLMQYDEDINVRQIVAFASRSLSPVEKLYAQIEKETLAATYAAEHFSEFITGSQKFKVLEFIHTGHLGIVKCRERAKISVWWIGLSTQIENLVRKCPNCIEDTNNKETFHKDQIPSRPWQKVALDLFKCNHWYLIVTDYYSRFFEIFQLSSLTEDVIVKKCKEVFSRYGIPEIVHFDGEPQFKSGFAKFAVDYNFLHTKSSPYFAQSNRCVEAAVKIAKKLLKKKWKGLF
ncbi:hypothetical protein JTB14_000165 [Gonioctena quinquepunctata]|nr:hypothetical protein JTB14_000165 [Gonioctena quinquepunctata]